MNGNIFFSSETGPGGNFFKPHTAKPQLPISAREALKDLGVSGS